MFKSGKTINQICYELNVKATIVSAILKEQNLIKNKYYYAGKTFHDINEYLIIKKQTGINIRSDFEKGFTHTQLMQKYNVSMRAIKVFLK
ncbi:MAG: hypothetical protein IPJ79_10130 [Bacteroidetes bacterium]|nr:hypothetical protein [Bacteroidota bacterium]